METHSLRLLIVPVVSLAAGITFSTAAKAQNYSFEEQQVRNKARELQLRQQQSNGPSPQVLQSQRWEREWREQHPNEPMPSAGALQKMHTGEIMSNINSGFATMRQNRQNDLKRQYLMSRQNQERQLAARHITWSAQQWKNWDREYDQQMHQRANEYLESIKQSRQVEEIQEDNRRRREVGY